MNITVGNMNERRNIKARVRYSKSQQKGIILSLVVGLLFLYGHINLCYSFADVLVLLFFTLTLLFVPMFLAIKYLGNGGNGKDNVKKEIKSAPNIDEVQKNINDIVNDGNLQRQIFQLNFQFLRFSSSEVWEKVAKSLSFSYINSKLALTDEAFAKLDNSLSLLLSVSLIIENILPSEEDIYELQQIAVGNNPDNPEWRPIEIFVKINSENFKEKLSIKHKIIDKAFEGVIDVNRKNIFIIGLM